MRLSQYECHFKSINVICFSCINNEGIKRPLSTNELSDHADDRNDVDDDVAVSPKRQRHDSGHELDKSDITDGIEGEVAFTIYCFKPMHFVVEIVSSIK